MNPQIQGWFDFQNIYDRMVEECRPGGTIIELGVWKGASLCYLAQKAQAANKRIRVIGIDNFEHSDWDGYPRIQRLDREAGETRSIYQQCRDNLSAVGSPEAELIVMDTIRASNLFTPGSVDFLFVDDTHNTDHVKVEIAAWIPKMRRPTWMAGHDYPGIIAAGVLHNFPDATQDGNCWIGRLA